MSKTSKMGIAIGLSVVSFLMFFAVGESSSKVNSDWTQAGIMAVVMGLFFLVAQYFLSRGNPRAVRTDWWLILCLNSILILSALIAAVVEPNKGAVLQVALVAASGVVCAYAGAAIAARAARRRAT
jgi:hypothetical protein